MASRPLYENSKHSRRGCRGCIFQSKEMGWCNYREIMGVTRASMCAPLLPNGGCRLKQRKPPEKNTVTGWKKYPLHKKQETEYQKKLRNKYETIRLLYEQGLNDMEIERETGIKAETVAFWRKRNGKESNYYLKREKARKGG